jgi:peptidylprolyl isomerase
MLQVKSGDRVTIEYEAAVKGGEVYETTSETGPLSFEVGGREVLPALDEAVAGMAAEESKTIEVPPENAYGPQLQELVQSFDRKVFGENVDPEPGMVLGINLQKEGQSHQVPGLVTDVRGEQVTIDFNHPLAGQTLVFKITVKHIEQSPTAGADGGSCSSAGCSGCH